MSSNNRTAAALVAAMMLTSVAVGSLPASAFTAPHAAGLTASSDVSNVYWRRGRGGWGWWGPGPGLAILGGVIIGGAIVASAVAEHRARGSDMRRCADEFRSFDPRSGTYIDRDGQPRVCPYLY